MFRIGFLFFITGFFAATTAAAEVVGGPQQTSEHLPASAFVSTGARAVLGGRLHQTRNYVQSRRIGTETAANIAWESAGRQGRVLHVRRYRDIFFVIIRTSRGNKTYCVRDNGEYLGQC